jgi:hypothetical protein
MTRRYRDLLRLLRVEAAAYGACVWIEQTNGSHLRATFSRGGERRFIIMSLSPRSRDDLVVRADARRALRTLVT